jgi:hypothetical protein
LHIATAANAQQGVPPELQQPQTAFQIGLITLLVLFAAIALLFTGRYPHSIFDFVLA